MDSEEGELTALHRAAEQGDTAAVQQLLQTTKREQNRQQDIKLKVKRARGTTPLHLAAEEGHASVVQQLVQAGAAVNIANEYRQTPLHLAAAAGHGSVVQQLLTAGADADAEDESHKTPLELAVGEDVVGDRLSLISAFLDAGTDPNIQIRFRFLANPQPTFASDMGLNDDRRFVMKGPLLVWAADRNAKHVVSRLLAAGADVNAAGSRGVTPLIAAVKGCYPAIVQQLLYAGARVDVADVYRRLPLYYAVGVCKNTLAV